MITLIFIVAMLLCVFCLLAVIACCQQAGRANRISMNTSTKKSTTDKEEIQ